MVARGAARGYLLEGVLFESGCNARLLLAVSGFALCCQGAGRV